jgi:16S rRNA (guanine1516-N2)-methyltransferase
MGCPILIPLAYRKALDAVEAKRLSRAVGLPLISKPLAPNDIPDFLGGTHRSSNSLRLVKSAEQLQDNVVHLKQQSKEKTKPAGLLYLDGDTLTLFCRTPMSRSPLSFRLDFTTSKMRNMAKEQNKKTLMVKAVGGKAVDASKWVVDATAGLGQDAFMLAYMGYRVTLIERSPVMAAMLSHAISSVRPDSWAFSTVHRMTLLHTDAEQWLSTQLKSSEITKKPKVIYLDPMFPHPDKKALSQKSMQMLQHILGQDTDADKLLPLAQAFATERVVVKRHRASPHLAGQDPHIIFEGKSHRFDVYLLDLPDRSSIRC